MQLITSFVVGGSRYIVYQILFLRNVEYLIGRLEEAFFAKSLPIELKTH